MKGVFYELYVIHLKRCVERNPMTSWRGYNR
nr:MAG TPA: hypothetical protein [Caudoviricetes sp.]